MDNKIQKEIKNKGAGEFGKENVYNDFYDIDFDNVDLDDIDVNHLNLKLNKKGNSRLDSLPQKESDDEYYLQLENDMKKHSKMSDALFGLGYTDVDKQNKDNKQDILKKSYTNLCSIVIITTYIILGILSVYYKRHLNIVLLRIFLISLLAGFLPNGGTHIRIAPIGFLIPFNSTLYNYRFYKTKRLSTILYILSFIFMIVYAATAESSYRSILRIFVIRLIPGACGFGLLMGYFIKWLIIFICRAIKGEINRKMVGKKILYGLVAITILLMLLQICMKYDISPEKYPILRIL